MPVGDISGRRGVCFRWTPATLCICSAMAVTNPAWADQEAGMAGRSKPGKTLGFVMTSFARALYVGQDDCPDGFVQRGLDGLLASISKPERDRINRPENAKERKKLDDLSRRGELCFRPDWLPAPPHRLVQGKISYGMDLDGGDTSD